MKLILINGKVLDCKSEIEELIINGKTTEYSNNILYDTIFKTGKNIEIVLKDGTIIKKSEIKSCPL